MHKYNHVTSYSESSHGILPTPVAQAIWTSAHVACRMSCCLPTGALSVPLLAWACNGSVSLRSVVPCACQPFLTPLLPLFQSNTAFLQIRPSSISLSCHFLSRGLHGASATVPGWEKILAPHVENSSQQAWAPRLPLPQGNEWGIGLTYVYMAHIRSSLRV